MIKNNPIVHSLVHSDTLLNNRVVFCTILLPLVLSDTLIQEKVVFCQSTSRRAVFRFKRIGRILIA